MSVHNFSGWYLILVAYCRTDHQHRFLFSGNTYFILYNRYFIDRDWFKT